MTNHYLLVIVQFVGLNAIYVQHVLQCMIYLSLYAIPFIFILINNFSM